MNFIIPNSDKWPPDKRADLPRKRTYGLRIQLFMWI